MGHIHLLDCTLRDGGYINNWEFGFEAIRGITRNIARSGVEYLEVGFIKGDTFSRNRTVYPDAGCIEEIIAPKAPGLMYAGMVDMSDPVPPERIGPRRASSLDAIRVIFKKDRREEGYAFCAQMKKLGYAVFAQLVGTDGYSDAEFLQTIERFNALEPHVLSLVDTLGAIREKQFLRLVCLADNNLKPHIGLGYHSHNNLQQAFGNARSLVELNLARDIHIDACVLGMGRGAGNLNLELFAEYLNSTGRKSYRLEPMLEIADAYLHDIRRRHFWGYSLPYYLSACNGCHPNYARYFSEKQTLTAKALHEIMRGMTPGDRRTYSPETAEQYYLRYMENYVDDAETVRKLAEAFSGRAILLLGPGAGILARAEKIRAFIRERKALVISLNFYSDIFGADYIFSSNMRRYVHLQGREGVRKIVTSNMKEAAGYDFMINFSTYRAGPQEIADNAAVMALNMLEAAGVRRVYAAGLDGYRREGAVNYCREALDFHFSDSCERRNKAISRALHELGKRMDIRFLTPSLYEKEASIHG